MGHSFPDAIIRLIKKKSLTFLTLLQVLSSSLHHYMHLPVHTKRFRVALEPSIRLVYVLLVLGKSNSSGSTGPVLCAA